MNLVGVALIVTGLCVTRVAIRGKEEEMSTLRDIVNVSIVLVFLYLLFNFVVGWYFS